MKVRVITASTANGEHEEVIFIDDPDDIKREASYFMPHGLTIDTDIMVEIELPCAFPFNRNLKRR